MAKIPTQEMTKGALFKDKAAKRLSKLSEQYLLLKKWRDRKTSVAIKNRLEFENEISKIFPLDHPNAKDLIMGDEARTEAAKKMDCDFLDDQYKARKMIMEETDKIYHDTYVQLEQERMELEQENTPEVP